MSERPVAPAEERTVGPPDSVRDPSRAISVGLMFFGALCVCGALWHFFRPLHDPPSAIETLATIDAATTAGRGWISVVCDVGGVLFGSVCCLLGAMLRWG